MDSLIWPEVSANSITSVSGGQLSSSLSSDLLSVPSTGSSSAPIDSSTSTGSDRDSTLAKLEIATLSVIFVLIVLGNSAVMLALIASRIKMQRMYYFLLHLSISDLITAFFNVLPQLIWEITVTFRGGNALCKFVKYIQLLGPYLSSYVLVMTAIDRYQAICHPLANCSWTARRAKQMITGAWTIALLCCTPQLFIFSYMQVPWTPPVSVEASALSDSVASISKLDLTASTPAPPEYFECWGTFIQPWGEKIYVLWYGVSVFFIPLSVLTFTYINITKVIWINAKRNRQAQANLGQRPIKSEQIVSGSCSTATSNQTISNAVSKRLRCASTRFSSTNSDVLPKSSESWLSIGSDRSQWRTWLCCANSNVKLSKHNQLPVKSKIADQLKGPPQSEQEDLSYENGRRTQTEQVEPSHSNRRMPLTPSLSSLSDETSATNRCDSAKAACSASQIPPTDHHSIANDTKAGESLRDPPSATVATTTSYAATTTTTLNSSTTITVTPRSHADPTKLSKAKIKTIKITVVVIICYISCSLPFVLVQLWAHWWPGAQTSTLWTGPLITITMLLPNLNSCVNPWIYLAFNRNLWYTLLRILLGIRTSPNVHANDARRQHSNPNLGQSDFNSSIGCSEHSQMTANGPNLSPTPPTITTAVLTPSSFANRPVRSVLKNSSSLLKSTSLVIHSHHSTHHHHQYHHHHPRSQPKQSLPDNCHSSNHLCRDHQQQHSIGQPNRTNRPLLRDAFRHDTADSSTSRSSDGSLMSPLNCSKATGTFALYNSVRLPLMRNDQRSISGTESKSIESDENSNQPEVPPLTKSTIVRSISHHTKCLFDRCLTNDGDELPSTTTTTATSNTINNNRSKPHLQRRASK